MGGGGVVCAVHGRGDCGSHVRWVVAASSVQSTVVVTRFARAMGGGGANAGSSAQKAVSRAEGRVGDGVLREIRLRARSRRLTGRDASRRPPSPAALAL